MNWLELVNTNNIYTGTIWAALLVVVLISLVIGFFYFVCEHMTARVASFLIYHNLDGIFGRIIGVLFILITLVIGEICIWFMCFGVSQIIPATKPTDQIEYTYQITDDATRDFFDNYEFVSYNDGQIIFKDK